MLEHDPSAASTQATIKNITSNLKNPSQSPVLMAVPPKIQKKMITKNNITEAPLLKLMKIFRFNIYHLLYNTELSILDYLIWFDTKYLNYKFDVLLIRASIKLSHNVLREDI